MHSYARAPLCPQSTTVSAVTYVVSKVANATDELYAVYSDTDAMRWVDDGQPIARVDCVKWVGITLKNYASRGYGMSALVSREIGSVIGFCGLVHPGEQPEAEIKYALKREFWGKGMATEAVGAVLEYGKRIFDLSVVIATVSPENAAARRVLMKVGMKKVASRRNDDGSVTHIFKWRPVAAG
ncbi:MAG: GNAT family N-acetyltransferase [Phormidesmis sp.]